MADFRRYVLALVLLALFAGLASAQISGGGATGPLTCTASVAVTPTLRSEGFTEQIGDIVLTCTGGQDLAVGSTIPTANITVFLNTQVTSRLLPNATAGTLNASEALLLIDEPGATLPGYGPAQNQTVNTVPAAGAGPGGTSQFVFTQPAYIDRVNGPTAASATTAVMSSSATSATAPVNVYQGVINGSTSSGNVTGTSVTFNGVPILPPVSSGIQRVYRMTNIRVNASALTGFAQPVIANISISGSTSLPISNPTLTTGFVQSSLTTSVKTPSGGTISASGVNFNQCSTQSLTNTGAAPLANNLLFTDNFATAFKTRVNPSVPGQSSGQGSALVQNVPGTIYNSESGFTLAVGGGSAGLADYGTRLKAAFNNIPSGVTIWVTSVNTVINTAATPAITGTGGVGQSGVPSGTPVNTPFAELVASETLSDNGFFPVTATNLPTTTANGVPITAGVVALAQNAAGTAVATWEVVQTNNASVETFNFGVYVTYTSNVTATPATPTPGMITVNLSYAPTPTQGAFAAAAGPASNNLPIIPRFADTSTAVNAINIIICRTILLFPYVVDVAGFDTGLAIENTSNDPFQPQTAGIGTKTVQSGTCTLYFDGQTVASASPPVPAPFTTATVTTQTAFANTASVIAPGFDGYIIAICNFQYAHGLAFIGQLGNAVNGSLYLALIIPDPATVTSGRPAALPAAPSNAEQLLQ